METAVGKTAKTGPIILVIFGITGDLAQRKLLPALYNLFRDNLLDERTVILGITRRDVSPQDIIAKMQQSHGDGTRPESGEPYEPEVLSKVGRALRMHKMSQVDPQEYSQLYEILSGVEAERGVCMNRLYYLSIPPQMFEPIVRNLGKQGLNASCAHGSASTRLLIEKPFGYDLASARELIQETGKWFTEDQIFRIDHYLAKPAVQNMLAFRRFAPQIETIWNARHIDHIEITAFEQIDIEGRATFYEPVGALRDFIQSHLLQVAAVATMELPDEPEGKVSPAAHSAATNQQTHTARLNLLESVAPISQDKTADRAVRGQYHGYRDEVQVPDSATETYARIDLEIDSDRWQGVTVRLQTGKAMAEKRTDVRLRLRDSAAEIVFHIQPETGVSLETPGATPAIARLLEPIIQNFNTSRPPRDAGEPDAYERVILDASLGDHTLFTTSQEILAAWRIVDGVVSAWTSGDEGLHFYPKGSGTVA